MDNFLFLVFLILLSIVFLGAILRVLFGLLKFFSAYLDRRLKQKEHQELQEENNKMEFILRITEMLNISNKRNEWIRKKEEYKRKKGQN